MSISIQAQDAGSPTDGKWTKRRADKRGRLSSIGNLLRGKLAGAEDITAILEGVLEAGDRIVLEGDNQKQASFLSTALASLDPASIHDLHLLISSISKRPVLAGCTWSCSAAMMCGWLMLR